MLVTFSCDAYQNITMFGDTAVRLIKMMGHSGVVPSAILAEDILSALEHLTRAIEQEKNNPLPRHPQLSDEDGDAEPEISLVQRAFPLMELLKAADKQQCAVMWR